MQVAVCQFAAGTDIAANTETARRAIAEAARGGADLAVLPEMAMFFDPKNVTGPGPHGEDLDGPFARAIAEAARQSQLTVVVGMVERDPDGSERDYNTLLVVGPDGTQRGAYRKIHLYDAFGFRESDAFLPGAIAEPVLVEVAGVTVAVLTCYDLRFPEVFRWAVDAGAELVALPAAWIAGPAKEQHWSTLLRARAIENTIYVAGCGQTGPYACGQSMIVDPMGVTVACAGERPGTAIGTVDPARIAEVRITNPSLANRRFAVIAQ